MKWMVNDNTKWKIHMELVGNVSLHKQKLQQASQRMSKTLLRMQRGTIINISYMMPLKHVLLIPSYNIYTWWIYWYEVAS